jgi:hypothetical protein
MNMGKGSGNCDRPGIPLRASDNTKTELNLDEGVISVSEIDTTLELQRLEGRWVTKDDLVIFQKRKEGWAPFSFSSPILKVFKEYGLVDKQAGTSNYELTHFSSLKAARQAVNDVSLEAGLNIDSRLTRGKILSYQIGDLPVRITREEKHWRVYVRETALPQSLQKHFKNIKEFNGTWYATGPVAIHYPTRKSGQQAVINWLAQIIAEK